MKRTFRITFLMVLMTIVTLSMASCDDLLNKLPFDNETTSEEVTTPEVSTTLQDTTTPEDENPIVHEHVWGEWTVVTEAKCFEDGISQRSCTGCNATEQTPIAATGAHTFSHDCDALCDTEGCSATREVDGHQYSNECDDTCEVEGCGATREINHKMVDGTCFLCGFIPVYEKESVYDNDGDGINDTYFFTPIFPEEFANKDMIYINSSKYEKELSSATVGQRLYFGETQNSYWYCTEGKGEYIVYKITVAEAGVYEMGIRIRLHDTNERATKYTINEGTENEYTFETSFQFATMDDVYAAHNNDYDQSCYMYGMRFNLVAGDNYIKLEQSTLISKPIFSRDYYFIKVGDPCTEHTWGEWITVKEANCEEDGLKKHICTVCYISEKAAIDDLDGVHEWRSEKIVPPSCAETVTLRYTCKKCGFIKDVITSEKGPHIWGDPIFEQEVTCTQGSDGVKFCTICNTSIKVHAFSQGHKWKITNILSDTPCTQEGSRREVVCENCGETRILANEQTYHIWSEYVEVDSATCTKHGKEVKTCTVCGATSSEQIHKLDHQYENGICTSCGHVEGTAENPLVFEKESVYDNDGDGVNDTYLFSPILPERFLGESAIHIWSKDYEADLSSSYVPYSVFSGHPNHVYFDAGQGQYAVYKITVAEAGVYEMAIHTRLNNTNERGAKFTVNDGTEGVYSFEVSYQFETEDELYAARENAYTMTSYMYGMYLDLQAGDNYIKVELSSGGEKTMQFREFYFVKA